MHIHVDFHLPASARERLTSELRKHTITFSEQATASVLEAAPPDESILEADVVFGQPDPDMILASNTLRFVQISTSGITRYDTREFKENARNRGLKICNSAHVYNEACAEHVFSFLLAQSRQLPTALSTRDMGGARPWQDFRDACVSLKNQSLVITGYGAIAERLVELLQPFQMKVTAFRRRARGTETVPVLTTEAELADALGRADHVVNILPMHPDTKHFFDANRFQQFKCGSIFYNIGRGGTVQQDDLAGALRAGRPAAAWLDVTDPEPLPADHPLWRDERVFITPHVAGGHHGESEHLVRHFLKNFSAFETGNKLLDSIL